MKSLYILVAISAANHFTFMGGRLAVVLYATHLEASPTVVGVLAAFFGLVSAFVSVPGGRLMDRSGPARPMLWCAMISVAGAALPFLWRDLAALFLVGILVGTFHSLFFIGHTQWLGAIGAPEDRAQNFSLASLGFSAATFSAPIVVGYAIDRLGYPFAFLLLAVASLYPVAVLAVRQIEPPAAVKRVAGARPRGKRESVLDLVRIPGLARIYGVSVIASSTWSIVSFLIPIYCVQLGISASQIGLILGSYSFASVVVRGLMPWLTRRFSSWQLMLMALASTGGWFTVFPLLSGMLALALVAFAIGLGMGMAGPLAQALLYDESPPGRVGEATGLRVTVMNTTSAAIPVASGAMSAALGIAPVFWALAAVLLVGSLANRRQWAKAAAGDRPRESGGR